MLLGVNLTVEKLTGSISNTIAKLNAYMEEDKKLAKKVSSLKREYDT